MFVTDKELETAIETALEAGYRHIGTAHVYENEEVIGNVLKRWIGAGKIKREDIFLVTKLPPVGMRPDGVRQYLRKSLDLLQVDYVDLYLVHVPFGFKDVEGDMILGDKTFDVDFSTDHQAIWKAMEEQVDKGLTKSIGLSNFNITQIQKILDNARIRPTSLQIELHEYHQQKALVEFCKKNNIVVTAYSPLGNPGLTTFFNKFGKKVELPNILKDPIVNQVAQKHNKSPAQILLKHIDQKGIYAIPKSTNPQRLRENMDLFDFKLEDTDVKTLNGLEKGVRLLDFTIFDGIKDHPEYPFPELR
ncbi:dihydrodiol dehydrogenase 3-like [Euwallacea similis]|uniref:dihydrodiol dehydrogenase 3-like n=1 Tax=Euwallacea similis TaxID=1736056 RepID=UPI003450C62C